jgi:hypothetical protein
MEPRSATTQFVFYFAVSVLFRFFPGLFAADGSSTG